MICGRDCCEDRQRKRVPLPRPVKADALLLVRKKILEGGGMGWGVAWRWRYRSIFELVSEKYWFYKISLKSLVIACGAKSSLGTLKTEFTVGESYNNQTKPIRSHALHSLQFITKKNFKFRWKCVLLYACSYKLRMKIYFGLRWWALLVNTKL